jgi:hypothetical protein
MAIQVLNEFAGLARRLRPPVRAVYDIGACRGMWTDARRELFPGAEFHLFEAIPKANTDGMFGWHYGVLAGPGVQTVNFYASAKPKSDGGDSYYKETTGHHDIIEPETMPARTLDSLDLPDPQVMKLDTQGSELDIMRGASKAMRSVLMVEYNAGGCTFDECTRFLIAHGLHPVAVEELHYRHDRLLQLDIIFVRAPDQNLR